MQHESRRWRYGGAECSLSKRGDFVDATKQMIANLHPDDLVDFNERAAIAHYCGGLENEEAEKLALAEVMNRRIINRGLQAG